MKHSFNSASMESDTTWKRNLWDFEYIVIFWTYFDKVLNILWWNVPQDQHRYSWRMKRIRVKSCPVLVPQCIHCLCERGRKWKGSKGQLNVCLNGGWKEGKRERRELICFNEWMRGREKRENEERWKKEEKRMRRFDLVTSCANKETT